MIETDNEGWESPRHQYNQQLDKIILTKGKIDVANTILKSPHHSLQPDMIMGWKPKLPSCPLPLSYFNAHNDQLIKHIPNDDRFKMVYLGQRYANSVQVNQQYSYFWKYRQRYSLNIAIVQEAVKNVGKNHMRSAEQVKQSLNSKDFLFDSSFQSGNLEMAVRVKPQQYDLFLRSDTNTKGHTNWYYFKVSNQDFLGTVQFNICNIGKTKTLYNKGMKPYVLQTVEPSPQSHNQSEKWSQDKTYDVCLVQRYCRYGFEKKNFQLQFKYNFKKANTNVYFAYGIPYTYSQLGKFIEEISESHKQIVKCQRLCQSLGGLNLPLLTISSSNQVQTKGENESNAINQSQTLSADGEKPVLRKSQKKAILITGRIHPGQSNASYVLEGFIRELLKNFEASVKLRQMYVFYIIPMLNPDGVVAGNFRTSYSGKDLNRQFDKLNKYIYPQIFALDQFATNLKQKYKKKLQFYFDFHGHSSKKNLFCYGPEYQPSNMMFFKCRTFAKIIEQINSIFSYQKSIFEISEHKKTTARAHMLWNIKIPMTYTFQISNGLYDTKQARNIHLNKDSMMESGKAIYRGLCRYVALETRNFGIHDTKAKIDTGIRSEKISSSEKGSREKGFKINKVKSNRVSVDLSRESSLEKNSTSLNKQKTQKNLFERYINEIKKQSTVYSDREGGSDSEGSQEDLSTEELSKIHEFVQSRSNLMKDQNRRIYNFKIKALNKINEKKRKFSVSIKEVDEINKENSQTQNIKANIKSTNGIDTSQRLYQMSQKIKPAKKPPLPLINTKYVLCQKKFTLDF